ncbi:MAG: acyl carrier protein [Pseudomonadota bacterium]
MSDTLDRLIAITARRFKTDPARIRPEADIFETLKIDSMAALSLLTELETEFHVEIPDYELQGVKTFAALARIIEVRR